MIHPINKNIASLSSTSSNLLPIEGTSVIEDLKQTLFAHRKSCLGMAANMIGIFKNVIAFFDEGELKVMVNPEIIEKKEPYEAEEGCLSLLGKRKCQRYQKIKVRYLNEKFVEKQKTYYGLTAEVIQHEIDHLSGIII